MSDAINIGGAPGGLEQQFETPAAEWGPTYWGGPTSMLFAGGTSLTLSVASPLAAIGFAAALLSASSQLPVSAAAIRQASGDSNTVIPVVLAVASAPINVGPAGANIGRSSSLPVAAGNLQVLGAAAGRSLSSALPVGPCPVHVAGAGHAASLSSQLAVASGRVGVGGAPDVPAVAGTSLALDHFPGYLRIGGGDVAVATSAGGGTPARGRPRTRQLFWQPPEVDDDEDDLVVVLR